MDRPSGVRSAAERLRATIPIPALLRDCRFFGVAGVQDHREEAGPGLATRIPGHPVHRSRRLVERIPGLVFFDRLVVEGMLVFALQDVAEHRAGMVFGYVLEGEYEHALDDEPVKKYKAGDTFYEPSGSVHRVARNPSGKTRTRLLAVILHSRDAKEVTVSEVRGRTPGR